jgi:hypothetical protein
MTARDARPRMPHRRAIDPAEQHRVDENEARVRRALQEIGDAMRDDLPAEDSHD